MQEEKNEEVYLKRAEYNKDGSSSFREYSNGQKEWYDHDGNCLFREFPDGLKGWYNHDERGQTIGAMFYTAPVYSRFGKW